MEKSISTIIPFFNSGCDLARMLGSIISGTVVPDEILLIDDGSTDDSATIALDYAAKYDFIKYIKQPHSGVSAARNRGIKSATGTYISFLDADDYIEKDMYELLLSAITVEDCAGSVCGYFTEKNSLTTSYVGIYNDIIYAPDLLEAMFTDDCIRGFLFTRLFNSKLIKSMTFDTDIAMCEDLLFQTKLLSSEPSMRFAYVPKALYHYVQNSTQSTAKLNYFNDGVFKYKPAFQQMSSIVHKDYVTNSYESILEYSMYCLLKAYKAGDKDLVPQIKLLKKEMKNTHPTKASRRRLAYIYAPLLYSCFISD